jgi:UV excision repair protein RAD23
MNGIPPGIGGSGGIGGNATSGGAASGGSLDALRNHPQFNDLRRLVQTNPSTLQTVLAQIGQQQPELLQAINANQAEFLQMMNEPVSEASAGSGSAAPSGSSNNVTGASSGGGGANPFSMDPTQLGAMLSSMPPAEQAAMAQMMGMSVEQLQQTAQMISAMPQEQVQQYMNMAMAAQGMDMGGLAGMMGGGAGGGGGAQVLRLSEEEMAAVDRLTEMGFDRAEAAQAYLACDKNEALAANLLMDGGFGGFGGDIDDGGADAGEGDDDMYD